MGPKSTGALLPLGFEDEPRAVDGEGHVDLAHRPDVGVHAVEAPAPQQFGDELVEPLSSLLRGHPFQTAHPAVLVDQLAEPQGCRQVEVVAVHGPGSPVPVSGQLRAADG